MGDYQLSIKKVWIGRYVGTYPLWNPIYNARFIWIAEYARLLEKIAKIANIA